MIALGNQENMFKINVQTNNYYNSDEVKHIGIQKARKQLAMTQMIYRRNSLDANNLCI